MSCLPRTFDSFHFQGKYGSIFRLIETPYPVPVWGMDLSDFTFYGDGQEYNLKTIRNNHDGTYYFEFHGHRKRIEITYYCSSGSTDVVIYQKKWFKKDKLISDEQYKMIRYAG